MLSVAAIAERLRAECAIVAWDLHPWGEPGPSLIEKVTEIVEHLIDEEIAPLSAAILNQSGDNLCWLTEATGAGQVKIPPQPEFLESCRRFHAQISSAAGELAPPAMTIAQLEAECEELRMTLRATLKLLHAQDGPW